MFETPGRRVEVFARFMLMNKRLFAVASILSLGVLACRPVLAIGWGEFLILAIAIALLIGPPLYRLFREFEKSQRRKDE